MRFRPCIDIHNGRVKQIVGASLRDDGDRAADNFVSDKPAAAYARMYRDLGLTGGHIILLNPRESAYYEETERQALEALTAYPGGMQIGGGIRPDNAERFLNAGASHVIVTSYVFRGGRVDEERLKEMTETVGREHLVLDLSCKAVREEGALTYRIATDRWQKLTDVELCPESMRYFAKYADELLIHAVDVEGQKAGIDTVLCRMLGGFEDVPVTYAGGIAGPEDIRLLWKEGAGRVDFTVGSALDIFGGNIPMEEVLSTVRSCTDAGM